jgi:LemA protein
MSNLNPRIPEEMAPEVFATASRLYAQKSQDYSIEELMQAASEAQIPPEFIQQAVQEIHQKRIQAAERKKRLGIIFASLSVAFSLWGIWTYNSLSNAAQKADAAKAQLENQLSRRADLIPNLISITQAYAKQESQLAALLTQSRETYLQANTPSEKVAASAEVSEAIERFNDYVTRNPQMRSSQAFINLQYELTGTENRIAVERMRYNQAVQDYNHKIQLFPNSLLARVFGFDCLGTCSYSQN